MTLRHVAMGLTILLMAGCAHANEPASPWQTTVAKFAGCWDGEGLGGDIAYCWMPGPDGRMTAAFQKSDADGFAFSEMIYIADFGDGPELRLKHFDPDLKGWEDKDAYLSTGLNAWTDRTLDFGWLRYHFLTDTQMEVELDMGTSEGKRTERLTFTKVD